MKIEDVIRTVNQMKADGVIANYAIGGAVGATFYLEPVSTLDVDIFIELHAAPGSALLNLDPIFSYLRDRGCTLEGEHILISGWPVQFLPAADLLIEEALERALEIDVAGTAARVFTAEHIAAIALQTGRAKDKARLLQFVETGALDKTKFEKLIERHGLIDKWRQFQRQFLGND
jgi:hypothetical protein